MPGKRPSTSLVSSTPSKIGETEPGEYSDSPLGRASLPFEGSLLGGVRPSGGQGSSAAGSPGSFDFGPQGLFGPEGGQSPPLMYFGGQGRAGRAEG